MTRSMSPPSTSDIADVTATPRDYVDGWYSGDAERMDRALHPDLVKRLVDVAAGGDLGGFRTVTKERMLELTGRGGGEDPGAESEVIVDHVSGSIAAARVLSPEYLDYLHLVKTPAGWRIANVLFEVNE